MRLMAALASLACLFAGPAHAETFQLGYRAVVLGVVELGTAEYRINDSGSAYSARATVRTSGLARLFDQTDITANANGSRVGQGVSWSRYTLSHVYGRKQRQIRMDRAGGGVTSNINPSYGDAGVPPATSAQQFGSYDPLSAVFALGRQVGAARACRGSVLVFDGRQHYRLSVSHRAHGTYNGGGYNGAAISCNFRYTPIAGFSENFDRSSVPMAQVWFALPASSTFAAPLQLIVPTPLGEGQLNLASYRRTP